MRFFVHHIRAHSRDARTKTKVDWSLSLLLSPSSICFILRNLCLVSLCLFFSLILHRRILLLTFPLDCLFAACLTILFPSLYLSMRLFTLCPCSMPSPLPICLPVSQPLFLSVSHTIVRSFCCLLFNLILHTLSLSFFSFFSLSLSLSSCPLSHPLKKSLS